MEFYNSPVFLKIKFHLFKYQAKQREKAQFLLNVPNKLEVHSFKRIILKKRALIATTT